MAARAARAWPRSDLYSGRSRFWKVELSATPPGPTGSTPTHTCAAPVLPQNPVSHLVALLKAGACVLDTTPPGPTGSTPTHTRAAVVPLVSHAIHVLEAEIPVRSAEAAGPSGNAPTNHLICSDQAGRSGRFQDL